MSEEDPRLKAIWFYGNDPARDADYHTVVINGLFPRNPNEPEWNPMLRDLFRFKKTDYLDVLEWLFNDLFKKMPPYRFVTDATRDPTFAELIVRKLGAHKAEPYKFTIDSKLHLMTINRQYYKQGYALPDVEMLERENRITPEKAYLIRELKTESLREQMRPIGDKISFSDGGKHNDLLHAQAMSLKGVFDYQRRAGIGASSQSSLFGMGAGDPYKPPLNSKQMAMENVRNRFADPYKTDKMKWSFH